MAFVDVISYEGENDLFVYKFPRDDFNIGARLIVRESQEAIFMKNGELLDVFGQGTHILETENLPIIRNLMLIPTGGRAPFQCELYYVNKVEHMAIKWGTDSKVQYLDPEYGFPLEIGASGEMSVTVSNSAKMLIKLVGTEKNLTREALTKNLRAILMTRFKTVLATEIKEKKISIFEIDSHLSELSELARQTIQNDFDDYGIALKTFMITTIAKPEDDLNYRRFVDLHYRRVTDVAEAELQQKLSIIDQQTKAAQTVIEADAMARKRQAEGYTYQEERGFDVAQDVARNDAVAQMGNVGIGMGMMTGVGGELGRVVGNATSQAVSGAFSGEQSAGYDQTTQMDNGALPLFCNKCGYKYADGDMFCPKCGNRRAQV